MPRSNPEHQETLRLSALVSTLINMKRVWLIVWGGRKLLLTSVGALYVFGAAMPFLRTGAVALLINHLLGAVGKGVFDKEILLYVGFLIFSEVLPPLVYTLQWYYNKVFRFYFEELFTMLVYSKMAVLDVASHEDPALQDIFLKVKESGVWRMESFASRQLFILQNIFEIIIAMVVLGYATWWLLLLLVVGTIPSLYIEIKYGREVWSIYGSGAARRRRFWALTEHTVHVRHLIELKLFQNVKKFMSLIGELYASFQSEQIRADRHKLLLQLSTQFFAQLTIGISALWFVHQVLAGEIAIGTFVFLLSSMGGLSMSLSGFFSNLGVQYQDNLFVTDVFKLLDLPGMIAEAEHPIILDSAKTPDIVFDHVDFSYPDSTTPILRDIDLHIPAGTKLAIVGLNGAGKTTLIKLLARFYDPTRGKITVDGTDLRMVEQKSWYGMIGALFQEYSTYDSFTIKEAIALGDSSSSEDMHLIEDAAMKSEAESFVGNLPKGYDSVLGKEFDNGIEPSIGQKQKLAIARVFYRDPRIWIFDEPTASVDAESEAHIFEKLEALPKDRTVILISHRFSTVRHADKIIVLLDGTIKESGTHEELVALGGEYARLFALQAVGYN